MDTDVCVYIYMYIYIWRFKMIDRSVDIDNMYVYIYTYTYVYVYIFAPPLTHGAVTVRQRRTGRSGLWRQPGWYAATEVLGFGFRVLGLGYTVKYHSTYYTIRYYAVPCETLPCWIAPFPHVPMAREAQVCWTHAMQALQKHASFYLTNHGCSSMHELGKCG